MLSKQSRASVASAAALQNEMSLLVSSVQGGNEQIVARLDVALADLGQLGAIFEHGFAHMDARLDGIERSLQELTRLTANRDQTWANEQYRIAGDAYLRGLQKEALDYASRAIEGYGSKPGYPLEAKYHLLRRTIRVGSKRNIDRSVVDLDKAISDFSKALRYSENNIDVSLANQKLAWASYCLGRFDDALRYAQAVATNQGRVAEEAKFIGAKSYARKGDSQAAVNLICFLGDINCLYFLRAFADSDFEPIQSQIIAEVDRRRTTLLASLSDRSAKAHRIIEEDREIADKYFISKNMSSLPRQIVRDATLKELLDLDSSTKDTLKNIQDHIDRSIYGLQSEIDRIFDEYNKNIKDKYSFDYERWAWLVGLTIAGLYIFIGLKTQSVGSDAFITGPLLGYIGGWIGSGILGFLGYIVHLLEMRGQKASEISKPSADLARLEKLKRVTISVLK